MNILMLNQNWFKAELTKRGHRVITCGGSKDFDISQQFPLIHIDTIFTLLPKDFSPQVVLVHDNSTPLMVSGLETCKIPTVFYSVDIHHHVHDHKFLAEVFDYTFVAQREYMPYLLQRGVPHSWLPLWASGIVEPGKEKKYDAVFVGTLDPALNPKRVRFFDELKKKVEIHCTTGNWRHIFPCSEVVINQSVKDDLNFRVFEAMVSGAMLLTESSTRNGVGELFEDGKHLMFYQHDNVDDAAQKIKAALSDLARTRSIGLAGREEILRLHTEAARAEEVENVLAKVKVRKDRACGFSAMVNFSSLGRSLTKYDSGLAVRALAHALRLMEFGLDQQESLCNEKACHAVRSALLYDRLQGSDAGRLMLEKIYEAYPQCTVLQLAQIRECLNQGKAALALEIAKKVSDNPPEDTFRGAEEVISSILAN